ncbi:MAG: phosphopentomutase [Clostridia bacterium]|nr:phosphopentomutase [Clostridia bacterium]
MEKIISRVFILVIDSFGIGGAIDAKEYGDEGSDTYLSISEGIKVPNLVALGINNIDGVLVLPKMKNPLGQFARLTEKSMGKDTVTGHFEIAGLITKKPLPTFPNGFPTEIIEKLEKAFGRQIIGNCVASGTEIIAQMGDVSTNEDKPIVYTSADSVLQIAANEDKISIEEIYAMCEKAREIMSGEDFGVGRIIARPFRYGAKGYYRTANRRDYSLPPQAPTMLDRLKEKGFEVKGVGKIRDIFCGCGLTEHIESHSNRAGLEAVSIEIEKDFNGLVFVNLVDTDMIYGHRNDVPGYRKCVEEFDDYLNTIISSLKDSDALIITADHGCDPSTPSTDHSREDVPFLLYGKKIAPKNLGTIKGFDFIANLTEELLTK